MVQLLEVTQDWKEIASSLFRKLSENAVARDSEAGLLDYEVKRLRDSRLLPLVVLKEYGGIGATWAEALKIVQELSKVDGAIGQLFGNHLNLTALVHVSKTSAQKKRYYRKTVQKNLFWANAITTRDTRLKIAPLAGSAYLHAARLGRLQITRYRKLGIKPRTTNRYSILLSFQV